MMRLTTTLLVAQVVLAPVRFAATAQATPGTVVTLVCFALAGTIPLTMGVLGHEGSTVLVVLNSLRLLFGKRGD